VLSYWGSIMLEKQYVHFIEVTFRLIFLSYYCEQTFLEKTKSMFISNYDGMPLDKVTPTVGLNGE